MKEVLGEFSTKEQIALRPVVDHWRLPYWDWAVRKDETTERLSVPELFRLPTVEIEGPNGRVTIDNPLHRFKFPLDEDGTIDGISEIIEPEGQTVPVCTLWFSF